MDIRQTWNQYKRIITKAIVAFFSLLFIGYFLQLFLATLPEDPGPFLRDSVTLFDFLLPGPADFLAIILTAVESIIIALTVDFGKK